MQENGSDFTLSKPTEGVKLSGAAAGGATVNGSTLWRHPLGGGRRCNVRIGSSRSAVTMNISWHRQLSDWIKVYNSGGILKTSTGGAYMKKAKNTTLDERLKIVTDCLANDKNYGAMALKYDCSYQQVRNWVIRYEKMGQAGLEDRRGRRIASLPSRTPEEELRDKIAELERRNLDLQMENDLLKKVRELERRGRYL